MDYTLTIVLVVIIGVASFFLFKQILVVKPIATDGNTKSYQLTVAGENGHNADGADRQEILRRCTKGEPIQLIPETTDPPTEAGAAIRVCRRGSGEQIGYLGDAEGLAAKVRDGLITATIASIDGDTTRTATLAITERQQTA